MNTNTKKTIPVARNILATCMVLLFNQSERREANENIKRRTGVCINLFNPAQVPANSPLSFFAGRAICFVRLKKTKSGAPGLGSFVYHLLRRRGEFLRQTMPWSR